MVTWPTSPYDTSGAPTYWSGNATLGAAAYAKDFPSTFITEFSSLVMHQAQQEYSVLRRGVREDIIRGEYKWYEAMEDTSMSARTSRYQDTSFTAQKNTRRRLSTTVYDVADLIEEHDDLLTLVDPTSEYVKAFAMAAGRQIDEIINDAFDQTVTLRENQDSAGTGDTIAWDSTNGTILTMSDADSIWEFIRLADKKMRENYVPANAHRYLALSAQAIYDMFGVTQFTSKDYQPGSPVATGQLPQVMGFDIIPYMNLDTGTDTSTQEEYTQCFAWAEGAIMLGVLREPTVKIDVRPDKNHNIQVMMTMGMGGLRLREEYVVEIQYPTGGQETLDAL